MTKRPGTYLMDGTKSIPLEALPEEAWTYIAGGSSGGKLRTVYDIVPWLFRGVHLRSQAVQDLPFVLLDQSDNEIDNSEDWKNNVGWLPNIFELLYKTEGALTLHGRNYLFFGQTVLDLVDITWLFPPTTKPLWDDFSGLMGFERRVAGNVIPLTIDEVAYTPVPNFWSETDRGRSPAEAAFNAAGVLMNVDKFAEAFFARGAIKATLLTVEGSPKEAEKTRLLAWWKRIASGISSAFTSDVVSASVKPVVVGEGMAELSDQSLTKEKREDISTALGIPQSILFSTGAVNRAVAQQDDLHFYTKSIIPDARLIETSWNHQMFSPRGYRLKFMPDSMSIFQADEEMRSSALSSLVTSGMELDVALEILGYDLTEEQWGKILAMLQGKQEQRQAFIDNVANRPPPTTIINNSSEEEEEEETQSLNGSYKKWERKALRRYRETGSAKTTFIDDDIPVALHSSISAMLELAESEDEIRSIFSEEWRGYP